MNNNKRRLTPITEGDLVAYIDGEATAEIKTRIENDPELLREAHGLATYAAILGATLDREDCPSPAELLQYEAKLVDTAVRKAIHQHVIGCEPCLSDVRQLRAAADLDEAIAPSRAKALWDRIRATGKELLEAQMAPMPRAAAQAVRGSNATTLKVDSGPYTVLISYEPDLRSETTRVEGQIMRASGELRFNDETLTIYLAGSDHEVKIGSFGHFATQLDEFSAETLIGIAIGDEAMLFE